MNTDLFRNVDRADVWRALGWTAMFPFRVAAWCLRACVRVGYLFLVDLQVGLWGLLMIIIMGILITSVGQNIYRQNHDPVEIARKARWVAEFQHGINATRAAKGFPQLWDEPGAKNTSVRSMVIHHNKASPSVDGDARPLTNGIRQSSRETRSHNC